MKQHCGDEMVLMTHRWRTTLQLFRSRAHTPTSSAGMYTTIYLQRLGLIVINETCRTFGPFHSSLEPPVQLRK